MDFCCYCGKKLTVCCHECSHKLPLEAVFCGRCGIDLKAEEIRKQEILLPNDTELIPKEIAERQYSSKNRIRLKETTRHVIIEQGTEA